MLVGSLHRRQHLLHDVHHLGEGNGVVLLDECLEVGPLNVLHHHILHAMVGPDIVNANDVGIIELGGRHRFALEAALGFRVVAQIEAQQLDRHLAFKDQVIGKINVCHAPLAKGTEDPVPVAKLVSGFHLISFLARTCRLAR